jgi:hypothetical protein
MKKWIEVYTKQLVGSEMLIHEDATKPHDDSHFEDCYASLEVIRTTRNRLRLSEYKEVKRLARISRFMPK